MQTACAGTPPPKVAPKESLSLPSGSEPLIKATLGEVRIEPFNETNFVRRIDSEDIEPLESYFKKKIENVMKSKELFGNSKNYSINILAKLQSYRAVLGIATDAQAWTTVDYELHTEDGTLLLSKSIASKGTKHYFYFYADIVKSSYNSLSANIAKLVEVLKSELPKKWQAYANAKEAANRYIEANLKREDMYFRVTSANAFVRTIPDADAREVLKLSQGDTVYVTGSLPSGWVQVSREGKPIGWVHSTFLREDFTIAPTFKPVEAPKVSMPAVPPPAVPTDVTVSSFDFGLYHALVVGNNEYHHLPKLHTAINDAQAIAGLLQNSYGFSVRLLKNGTRADILRTINGYRRTLTNRDNLLIYFAGHGWLDKEADQGYWLPVDAEEYDPTNWISNSSITDALRAIQAKHVLVIADSCYSGKLARGINIRIRTTNYYNKILTKKARTVMASGGLEPVADEGGKGKHSVFAAALIDALNENQSVLDATLLFSQIRRPVMVNTDQTPEYSDIRKAGHDGGDFIFVKQKR